MNSLYFSRWFGPAIASIFGGLIFAAQMDVSKPTSVLFTGGGLIGLVCLTAKLIATDRRHKRLLAYQEAKSIRDHTAKMADIALDRDCLNRHNQWVAWAHQVRSMLPHLPEPPSWAPIETQLTEPPTRASEESKP